MKIMDCTLRDGANIVGNGFSAELTELMLSGLTDNGIGIIEFGNAKGLGGAEKGYIAPLSDQEYLEAAKPYMKKANMGMFLNAARYNPANIELAAEYELEFLRLGSNAGDGRQNADKIRAIKDHGMSAYYALMKAYILTPQQMAEEARILEDAGIDEITIMDSAGCMLPDEVSAAVESIKKSVKAPVGFHCHANLGMCAANCMAAFRAGADILDCGLLGMARSAGNMPTELAVALMRKENECRELNFYGLLHFIQDKLVPAMEKVGYHAPLQPKDLILGYSGCHSSYVKSFRAIAEETGVDIFQLIVETSAINRKNPDEALMREVSRKLKKTV